VKAYVAFLVCLSTKDVHLDLCQDLSTESFIVTFRRFIAKRGIHTVISDNGKNFMCAAREIAEVTALFQSQEFKQRIFHPSAEHQVQWKFIPECTPHFGGFWETSVRSMKILMKKIIGTHCPNCALLDTIIIEVEATYTVSMLNSRPLLPIQLSDSGPSILTLGHFVIEKPI